MATSSPTVWLRLGLEPSDLVGLSRLSVDGVLRATDLVEEVHAGFLRAPTVATHPRGRTRGITALAYRSVRAITWLVGAASGLALSPLSAMPANLGGSAPRRDAMLAALNGVVGDYLAQTGNPLATTMSLRHQGVALPLEREAIAAAVVAPSARLLVVLHGLCMFEEQWGGADEALPVRLAGELGATALGVRYNSGRHISHNGRDLANLLEAAVAAWPVPVREVVVLAHSMGGLVARSAVHHAIVASQRWPRRLSAMVFLGTPHHGAPLERGGNWINLMVAASPYLSPLAKIGWLRSAGITDLRYGNLRDDDWANNDRFAPAPDPRQPVALPAGVACFAVAARAVEPRTVLADTVLADTTLADAVLGDGLVPVPSALGHHEDPAFDLAIPADRQWIADGRHHFDLLNDPGVDDRVVGWLTPRRRSRRARPA